jgi:hypothetical protein
VPLIAFSQLLLTVGIACLLSSLGVYIRDIKHIMALALSAWMYATPIVIRPVNYLKNFNFYSGSIQWPA